MEFIKKHRIGCIIGVIVLVFIIILFFFLKQFMVDGSKSTYGNRLDGIDKVKISDKEVSKLKEEMKETSEIDKINYNLQGRLIYIEITVNDGVSIDTAKELSNKVLDYFNDDEKSYYDIQIILTNKNDKAEGYPTMGYKHKTSEALVW